MPHLIGALAMDFTSVEWSARWLADECQQCAGRGVRSRDARRELRSSSFPVAVGGRWRPAFSRVWYVTGQFSVVSLSIVITPFRDAKSYHVYSFSSERIMLLTANQPSKDLPGGGELSEAQVDAPRSV
jgi:hypothetical protein